MTDHAAEAARSAAVILAPDLGRNLPVEVEAALAARVGDQRNPTREQKTELNSAVQEPEADPITRQIRIKLREQDEILPPGTNRIAEVVVTEIIRQARQPGS